MLRGAKPNDPVNAEDGFTLFELLVVLAVIALAAALVAPMFGTGTSPGEIRALTREVAAELNLARSTAIRTGAEVAFVVDVETPSFRVGRDAPSKTLPSDIVLDLKTARSQRIDKSKAAILFYPDGSATGGRLRLEREGVGATVRVEWLTGRVEVEE